MTRDQYKQAKIVACDRMIEQQQEILQHETGRNKRKNAETLIIIAKHNKAHITSGLWDKWDEYYYNNLYANQDDINAVSAM